jgi:uncharacterized cupin superfamily protein
LKPERINVTYYLFKEYEIHYDEQLPGSVQSWHYHKIITETIFIIEGELTAKWKEDGVIKEEIVKSGDLVQTENTPHTFINHTDVITKFLVIKIILKRRNYTKIFKSDKFIYQPNT